MLNLQISRWGNSLAVRIPADFARLIGAKEEIASARRWVPTVRLICALRIGVEKLLHRNWPGIPSPMGKSVIGDLRHGARY